MNKSIKRGLLLGLASGFLALLFGGWAMTVLAVFGGILIGFTSKSGAGKAAAFSPKSVAVSALIFSIMTAIGGLVFDLWLADLAIVTDHPPEVAFPAAIAGIVLGTLSAVGMAYVQHMSDARAARRINYGVGALVLILLPIVDQLTQLGWAASIIFAGVYIVLAIGLDVVVGYAGLLNLGYAAFFGFGAYATALLSSNQIGAHVNFWLLLWIAAAIAGIGGVLLGAPTLGLRGDYIAIITLGFGEIVPVAFQQLIKITIQEPFTCVILPAIQSIGGGIPTAQCITLVDKFDLTGGVRGINPIDRPAFPIISPTDEPLALIVKIAFMLALVGLLFFFFRRQQRNGKVGPGTMIFAGLTVGLILILFIPIPHTTEGLLAPFWNTFQPGQFASDNLLPWWFFLLAVIGLVIFLKLRLKNSRLGRAMTAIREDELAANQMGVDLVHTKLTAFAFGAAIAGLAGAFYSAYVSAVFPDGFGFGTSIIIMAAIVLGGLGSIPGNILGALIIFLADLLFLKQFQNVLNGLSTHVLMPAVTDPALKGFIIANLDPVKYRFLLLGLVLVLVMAFRPEGLLPTREQRMQFHAEEPIDEEAPAGAA
ncbi:MAG: branched-chain amino acid ABC transporter permease [Thermoflexales bacterium]|nr:branched-chain amino acid ABC transporter permease [Thermoflexales bacterium]